MSVFYAPHNEPLYLGSMPSSPCPLRIHEAVEIAYVLSGSCVVRIDNLTYTLGAGDFAVIFPLMAHSFDALSDDFRGFTARFLPGTIAEFAQTFHTLLPDDPVVHSDPQDGDARALVDRLMAMASSDTAPYRMAYLHLLLVHVLQQMTFHSVDTAAERPLAAQVIRYVYEHACESLTLSSVARSLGVSRSHLSHLFSIQFQVNFRRFINTARINRAILMMRDPMLTLSQICYSCGYENMRTFRRAFVQETGILPSEYLRRLRCGAGGNA